MDLIRRSLTSLGVFAGHPIAFLVVAIYGVLWLIFDRENFGWHGVAVLATWFMTLLIQRSNHLTQIDGHDVTRYSSEQRSHSPIGVEIAV